MKKTDEVIEVDTNDFTMVITRGEYANLKKIAKALDVSINYYLFEFDVNIEAND